MKDKEDQDQQNTPKREKKKGKGESVEGRKQFEKIIDEDTSDSEEPEEIKISRVGYIQMKKLSKKNTKKRVGRLFIVLFSAVLFFGIKMQRMLNH